ncbi:ferredoxin--NADP reductase [Streptomyces iconiensis]|uniref:Ferredoxin--NADP reductase n=1 Tax=Streptomyces iconiensis TaxID=1384038 RepID=A0ABT7A2H0_9ACTN|nr:ferredoxin--NADP reductase [Streptomyces iconiensis]MDJ1135509.1 ferredoxin--NADP reductase [Streptomyces iconiensis]
MGSRPLTVRVTRVVRETADAVSLELRTEAPGPELRPLPGQFLTVRLPGGGARCYSFSRVAPEPRITVKRVPGGAASTWLCDEACAGLELSVLPPSGAFTLRPPGEGVLLVAGGSGITPVLALARAALEEESAPVVLVYANRDESSVIFARELRELAARFPARLLVHHWLESVQGLPTVPALAKLSAPYATYDTYLCGPPPLTDAAATALRGLGVPRARLHREVFTSLSGDAFAEPPDPTPPTTGNADLLLELDGVKRELDWPRSTTLLDTLIGEGLDPPYSCREGSCGACACRVLDGEVVQRTTGVLTDEDTKDGYVLACQATPTSGRVSVSYD